MPALCTYLFHGQLHSLRLIKCKHDKIPIGQKYIHQNSKTATPIHAGLSALNTPSMGKNKQDIKNTPCTMRRYFRNLSAFVCWFTANPAKNAANDITAYMAANATEI